MKAVKRCFTVLAALLLVVSLVLPPLAFAAPAFDPPNELERRRQALYSFLDAAFSVEYGNQERNFMLRWQDPIRVSLEGEYQPEDEAVFDNFIGSLEDTILSYGGERFPGITRVEAGDSPNLRVIFCPLDEMDEYMSFYEPDNWGLFEYYYDNYRIHTATVTVANDITNQQQRNHLLMEEMVGTLGLTNDIYSYSDSIVYQPWTETQMLSDLDWHMLAYLYSAALTPGMNSVAAYEKLLPIISMP